MQSSPVAPLPPLVPAAWLAAHLREPDLVVLDCSWYLPSAGRDPEAEYQTAHIPGAVRFDLDAASDRTTDLPHMLPSAERFAEIMEHMGIRPGDRVVCYDGSGVNLSAARVWWMFRVFGHAQVAVLDGGFATWASETRPVQRGIVRRTPTGYRVPAVHHELVRERAAVERIVAGEDDAQLADCRPAARFHGEVDEPRAGLRRGHIDGALSAPFTGFTDPETQRFKRPSGLAKEFAERGLDLARPIVASCGSGTSACVLALALEVIRDANPANLGPPVAIYDGSWAEWGRI